MRLIECKVCGGEVQAGKAPKEDEGVRHPRGVTQLDAAARYIMR